MQVDALVLKVKIDHSKNSGRNQKMTPTPTRMLQDPRWCSRKCIELAKTTSFAAYCRTLNPEKKVQLACFCIKHHCHLWSWTFLFKYFYCRKFWWTSFITSWRKTHKQQISWQSLANCSTVTPTKVSLLWGKQPSTSKLRRADLFSWCYLCSKASVQTKDRWSPQISQRAGAS